MTSNPPEVTALLTSCGRQDLLERTIDSFIKMNTYPLHDFIVYEDSGIEGINDRLKIKYPFIRWIEPKERTGQIVALDTLFQACTTPYAFMQEDDWLFIRPGFIEASMAIMEALPRVAHVWLRDRSDLVSHPITWGDDYGILKSAPGMWAGFQFSPSLKRLADYKAIGSYGRHTTFERHRPWKAEAAISQLYNRLGYKAAILVDPYIRHIGDNGRHVN